jgi:hypothetical protein
MAALVELMPFWLSYVVVSVSVVCRVACCVCGVWCVAAGVWCVNLLSIYKLQIQIMQIPHFTLRRLTSYFVLLLFWLWLLMLVVVVVGRGASQVASASGRALLRASRARY